MFFGQGFLENKLPPDNPDVEAIAKNELYQSLANATRTCKTKAQYGKGEHSFKLLALLDPVKVMDVSPWARRFIDGLKDQMSI